MKDIKFLWRENYIDYLWATETTGRHYFIDSGYFIYTDGVLVAYATKEEIKKSKADTKHLIDNPEKILDIKNNFDEIKLTIDVYHKIFSDLNLSKLSNKEIYDIYIQIIGLYGKFIEAYKFTEPHMVGHVENKVKRIIEGVGSSKKTNIILSKILSNRNSSSKYGLENYKNVFNLVTSVAKVRFDAKTITSELLEDTERLLAETSRRTFYAVNQVSNMSLKELRLLLVDNKNVDIKKINTRIKKFGIAVTVKGKKTRITDMNYKKIRSIEKIDKENNGKITGDSVYPGKVIGIVRLVPKIFSQKEYNEFISTLKRGDIIVAPMTSPGLTPGFSKVSGVITDEGGLMSHAALVSREKKVPCVVGTKNATQILKEGTKIELDADEGIIKVR